MSIFVKANNDNIVAKNPRSTCSTSSTSSPKKCLQISFRNANNITSDKVQMDRPSRLILDVDVGIDDAVAILLFLHAEKLGLVKIEAFVCTSGNAALEDVCRNLVRLLEVTGRNDIPVYKGSHGPMLPNFHKHKHYHGVDGFGDLEHETEPNLEVIRPELASTAIRKLVTDNPGEISVVCLGPLTNVALAMRIYPDFERNVDRFYVMGGNYTAMGNETKTAEFNFHYDPEAAYVFFETCTRPTILVPWECCRKINLHEWRWNVLAKLGGGPLWKLISRAEKSVDVTQKRCRWSSADSYVPAAMLCPGVIKKSARMHFSVEIFGVETRGQVVVDHLGSQEPNVEVVQEIDLDVYKEFLLRACSEM